MRKFIPKIVLLLFFLIPLISFAQIINGKVISEKDATPVEAASIEIKGKKTGTKTDANGNFSINAVKDDILIISSVSYKGRQINKRGYFFNGKTRKI